MKKLFLGAILALSLSINAHAYWECGASSLDGWGVGQSNNKFTAENIAMQGCKNTTSYWNICRRDYCTWYNGFLY